MTAPAPSFTRSDDGYAVWVGETMIGHVERDGRRWSAITAADARLGDTYSTRTEAASALAVTARRVAEVEAIADAAEPVEQEVPAPIVTVEQLVADTLRLGYRTVREYVEAPGREVGQVTPWTLDRAERAFAREVERTRLHDDPPAPRITTREELIARQIARGVTPERAAMIADARDALQAELTATAPAIAAALDDSHLGPEVDDPRDEPAPLDPREVVVPVFGSPGWALSLLPENRHSDRRDDLTVTVVDGFRPHVDTTVRCLGCGQLITVNVDGDTECGGAGEGTCDALDGHAGPVEDSHHDAADAAHDALLGYQLAHEARA
jgi:hypothetical protein